ncbi:MAG: hypothetical protein NG712_02760 [Omnitrophica bacterium]|nr:hypothetical protein [Candidatus Omnitrophota bacterium]
MRKDVICGLDIGTTKLCLTCGLTDSSGKINILGTQTIPVQGLLRARILDERKLSEWIREACLGLRKMCGLKVRRVYANIDSPDLRAKVCEQRISFDQDARRKSAQIKHAINSAISSNIPLDRKVIQAIFHAEEASLKITLVSAFILVINSLSKSIKDAGLIVEELLPSGYAQAWGLFRDFENRVGQETILVDFGAGLTKITLFEGKLVKQIIILPLGVNSISEDIAVKLKVSAKCAQQLKIKYGRILLQENANLNQKIIIRDRLIDKVVGLEQLYEVIGLKVDFILQETKKALLKINCPDNQLTEIIVTGGGSILEGFLEKAERSLARPVKMGFLYAVKDNLIQAQSALYATSIGLIRYATAKKAKLNKFYLSTKFNALADMHKRTQKLYREYF